ncbi:dihydroneopterin aldolase [Prevotella sp. 10(H)]|uniref:dihydroneopterin aldolase n=1 Tax=Prevotella sp. 10(H) TaxID=1158294 RepID=UPI0004A6B788|nr:dihydroneopterin aldolase [Prevotella sp. 10(H)]
MKSFILLENLTFYANHGVFPQETAVGNVFIVNLKIQLDLSKAASTDDIEDTVSYADIYEDVKNEILIPSKLLEHAAKRIICRLKEKYTRIESVEVKISKRNPPIGGQVEFASVILID